MTVTARRWLLGLEPIFEGGWRHKGRRAQSWDVEDELVVLALLGDVTVDLAHANTAPAVVTIRAYAILRDVDVFLPSQSQVEVVDGEFNGDLINEVPSVPDGRRAHLIRIRGRAIFGAVTVRATQERLATP